VGIKLERKEAGPKEFYKMAVKCEYQLIKSDIIPSKKWRLAYFF
jgi:hypothetical protein